MSLLNKVLKLYKLLLEEEQEQEKPQEEIVPQESEGMVYPMDILINKFDTLKQTLIDLMSPAYKDYISNIHVIAPKPTTFKVELKNGQHFFLYYDPKSYIAKISGKKYYLLNLGEEERAIQSIADLLTLGKPKDDIEGPSAETPAKSNKKSAVSDNFSDIENDLNGEEPNLTSPEGENTAPEETGNEENENPEELQENYDSDKKSGRRYIPQYITLESNVRNNFKNHIKVFKTKDGEDIKAYISPLLKTALESINRGRTPSDYQKKASELSKEISNKIPNQVRNILKNYSPKINTSIGMFPINNKIYKVEQNGDIVFYNPYNKDSKEMSVDRVISENEEDNLKGLRNERTLALEFSSFENMNKAIEAFKDPKMYGMYLSRFQDSDPKLKKHLEDTFGPSIPNIKRKLEKERGKPFEIKTQDNILKAIKDFYSGRKTQSLLPYEIDQKNIRMLFPRDEFKSINIKDILKTVMTNARISCKIKEV